MNTIRLMLLAALLAAAAAMAQEPFPARPISLVVPAQPGGLTDVIARATAPALGRALGQPVIVVNRPGAGGAVGSAAVAKAKSDGYTMLLGLTSVATFPEQERITGKPSSFKLDQLTPLGRLSTDPIMLTVPADSPYKTLGDIIADAKNRPATVTYSTTGIYGTYHVAMEMLASEVGLKMVAVHYNSGAAALNSIVAKEVGVGLVSRSVALSHLRSGLIRPIAAWGDERWEQFPAVRSLKDEGYRADYKLWTGLFVPSGLPAPVFDTLRNALARAVADPEYQATMSKLSAAITYLDAPEFKTFWDAEAARLVGVVRKIGRIE